MSNKGESLPMVDESSVHKALESVVPALVVVPQICSSVVGQNLMLHTLGEREYMTLMTFYG